MKKINISPFFVFVVIMLAPGCEMQQKSIWKPASSPLLTRWTATVDPQNPWPEYPRPQLMRSEWLNLNGLWDYAIVSADSIPLEYEGQILVPYPVESALSGVARKIGKDKKLWYRREIAIPSEWKNKIILLNFEAVDWEMELIIDGKTAGTHKGGYDPFVFDITNRVKPGKQHELQVITRDPTSDGFQPRGKQVNDPHGIWYTSASGIWQTVWLEPVGPAYISNVKIIPVMNEGKIVLDPQLINSASGDQLQVSIFDGDIKMIDSICDAEHPVFISIPEVKLWTPDNPFLYDLDIYLLRNGQILDQVDSYFGMRKISIIQDEQGLNRMALNNEILFQNGPLDQGFWPDGIYTPPSDEAMKYDIEVTKQMGFNMLRKHVKVENRRFYSWCDRLGVLVWQDMPSASGYVPPGGEDLQPSELHAKNFEQELSRMIKTLFNHPSIVMWVPFNEGWGQYDTQRIVDFIYAIDSTRLVNNASGWEDRNAGDVLDIHHYPDPMCPERQESRAGVLGEFGGLGYFVEGHSWQQENWGYEKMQKLDDLLVKYEDYYQEIFRMRDECGLAASVYTQTTDVETETNGLLTYDRDQVKMGIENIQKAHNGILPPRLASPFRKFIHDFTIELTVPEDHVVIYFTQDGSDPTTTSQVYSAPVRIEHSTLLKTMAEWPEGQISRVNSYQIEKVVPLPATAALCKEGLNVQYYEGTWDSLPDFYQIIPLKTGVTKKADLSFSDKNELFGLAFQGFLKVPQTGVYNFYLSSDDGGRMFLENETLIDYDGIHGPGIRKATVALEQGLHPFRLIYFQRYGGLGLHISWEGPGMEKQEIQETYWKHN
jgi:hypothetical protein